MASTEVYSPTTMSEPKDNKWFLVPTEVLDKRRFWVKLLEVLLSFVAFILEEVILSCQSCGALYFFEFVSCTAFLFTALLLVLLSTKLYNRVGLTCWPAVDLGYTAVIAVLFFVASCGFAAGNLASTLEKSAVAFGFLATLAFIVDAVMFWRCYGNPFRKSNNPEAGNGTPPAESERLNATENPTD